MFGAIGSVEMINAVIAVAGLLALAIGAALIYVPAGVLVAGIGLIVAAYVKLYMEAQRETSRASGR